MSEEALQIAEKRRDAKGKEIPTRMQSSKEQQRKVRKSSSLINDQYKEIEENNRMRKKIRDTKGTFQANMDTIRDRNGMDLTEAEILRRGGKNTQKNCEKRDVKDPGNHKGVITHPESDILECEVKWALGSITKNKASGGDGIPAELFQILKDDAVSVVLNMPANLENSAVATELEKVNFHSNPKERQG